MSEDFFEISQKIDPTCLAIRADRSRFGRVMWLFGDSIFRGNAFGKYGDLFTPQELESDPLLRFRSPSSTINFMLNDYGLLDEEPKHVVSRARYVACYAGLIGQPTKTRRTVRHLQSLYAAKLIQPHDALIFLNAGVHTMDPDLYQAQWETILAAAKAVPDSLVVLCDTFDNVADRRKKVIAGQPADAYKYEVGFPSSSGRPISHNEATWLAFERAELPSQRAILLPLARLIREWSELWMVPLGPGAYLNDQIHLNVWGQLRLSAILMNACWPELKALPSPGFERLIAENWQGLYAGSRSDWSSQDALALARESRLVTEADLELDGSRDSTEAKQTAAAGKAALVSIIQQLRTKNLALQRLIEKQTRQAQRHEARHASWRSRELAET